MRVSAGTDSFQPCASWGVCVFSVFCSSRECICLPCLSGQRFARDIQDASLPAAPHSPQRSRSRISPSRGRPTKSTLLLEPRTTEQYLIFCFSETSTCKMEHPRRASQPKRSGVWVSGGPPGACGKALLCCP